MSIKESKRRKIIATVMKRAWYTFRHCMLSFRTCLRISWKVVRFKLPVYYSKVRGTTYESRQRILLNLSYYDKNEVVLFFEREINNPHDTYAVRIVAKLKDQEPVHIGYLSRNWSQIISPLLDQSYEAAVFLEQITGSFNQGHYLGLNFSFTLIEP